jgi:hypothetical protein
MPRPRYKETPIDEEKIKHFSKKFEEQDLFPEVEARPATSEEEEAKLKRTLYAFAEIEEPAEEKRKRMLKEKEAAKRAKEEAKKLKKAKAKGMAGATETPHRISDKVVVTETAQEIQDEQKATPSQPAEKPAPAPTHAPQPAVQPAAPQPPASPKPMGKAEAQAIQQYQAKMAEVQHVKVRSPIMTGFLFGVGMLLFLLALLIILFSIAVIMGVSVSDLLGMII